MLRFLWAVNRERVGLLFCICALVVLENVPPLLFVQSIDIKEFLHQMVISILYVSGLDLCFQSEVPLLDFLFQSV